MTNLLLTLADDTILTNNIINQMQGMLIQIITIANFFLISILFIKIAIFLCKSAGGTTPFKPHHQNLAKTKKAVKTDEHKGNIIQSLRIKIHHAKFKQN